MASRDEQQALGTPSVGSSNSSAKTYCHICGKDAADPSLKRFGEYFCSEAHVAEYTQEVRVKPGAEPTAAVAVAGKEGSPPQAIGTAEAKAPQKKGGLGAMVKMAACCGGMILLLPALGLVSAGGIAAVAGSALSVAAALACPLGMYFMMRAMMKRERGGSPAEQKKQVSDDTVNQGVKR